MCIEAPESITNSLSSGDCEVGADVALASIVKRGFVRRITPLTIEWLKLARSPRTCARLATHTPHSEHCGPLSSSPQKCSARDIWLPVGQTHSGLDAALICGNLSLSDQVPLRMGFHSSTRTGCIQSTALTVPTIDVTTVIDLSCKTSTVVFLHRTTSKNMIGNGNELSFGT